MSDLDYLHINELDSWHKIFNLAFGTVNCTVYTGVTHVHALSVD